MSLEKELKEKGKNVLSIAGTLGVVGLGVDVFKNVIAPIVVETSEAVWSITRNAMPIFY